jgi:hypothetical protein
MPQQCHEMVHGKKCPYRALDDSDYCREHQPAKNEPPTTRHPPEIGEALRDKGMALVSINNDDWYAEVTPILRDIVRKNGKVGADDLYYYLRDHHLPFPKGENAYGVALKKSGLRPSSEIYKSTRPSRHRGESHYWVMP